MLEEEQQQHLYTSDEKIRWFGYGEWVEEPDHIEFDHLGYACKIIRVCIREDFAPEEKYFGGHFCGYVQIPKDHVLYGLDEDTFRHLDMHGGLTFCENHEQHWIGFDCAHSYDIVPSIEMFRNRQQQIDELQKMFPGQDISNSPVFSQTYRNAEYVIKQCQRIAQQLANIQMDIIMGAFDAYEEPV